MNEIQLLEWKLEEAKRFIDYWHVAQPWRNCGIPESVNHMAYEEDKRRLMESLR